MSDISEGIKNRIRYFLMIETCGQYTLKEYLKYQVNKSGKPLDTILKENLRSLQQKFTRNAEHLNKINSSVIELEKWDVSLLCDVIVTVFKGVPENKFVYDIKRKRNDAAHSPDLQPDEEEFQCICSVLKGSLNKLANDLSRDVRHEIQTMMQTHENLQIHADSVFKESLLTDTIRKLHTLLAVYKECDSLTNSIKGLINDLEQRGESDFNHDVSLQVTIHSMNDSKTATDMEILFTRMANHMNQDPRGGEGLNPILQDWLQNLNQNISVDGENEIAGAVRKCVSIRIRCHTVNGLLHLLKYIISNEYTELLNELASRLEEHASEKIRITSCITKQSIDRIRQFIDGSEMVDEISKEWNFCSKHPDNNIEYHCGTHDTTFCNKCRSLHHKSCNDVQRLSEMKALSDDDIKDAIKGLNDISEIIYKTQSKFEMELSQITVSREQRENEILMQKNKLLKAIKKIEQEQQKCTEHYNSIEKKKVNIIEAEISSCTKELQKVVALKTCLESSKAKTDKQNLQIAYKTSKKKQEEGKTFIEEKDKKYTEIEIPKEELEYVIDTKPITDSLQSLQEDIQQYQEHEEQVTASDTAPASFYIAMPKSMKHKTPQSSTSASTSLDTGSILKSPSPLKTEIRKTPEPSSVRKEILSRVNVSLKDDTGPSSIFGCCVQNEDEFLVADNTNRKLKRIVDNNVKDSISLSGHPWDVCSIDKNNVVVAIYSHTLEFISTKGVLSVTQSITLKHKCQSLSFEKGSQRLVVLDHSNVYLYTTSGQQERVLYTAPPTGISLRRVTASPAGDQYCISTSEGVLIIDGTGKTKRSLKLEGNVEGVCYDPNLDVYVCNKDSVLRLDRHLKTTWKLKHGITTPKSLGLTDDGSKLIVGQDNDTVLVFDV